MQRSWLLAAFAVSGVACRGDSAQSAEEITDRAWSAHALVIAAGEHAKTCAEAGAAMQRVFGEHRQAFVDAVALDQDTAKLAAATAFIEAPAHAQRYADLETRMEALSERCSEDRTVQAAFEQMSSP